MGGGEYTAFRMMLTYGSISSLNCRRTDFDWPDRIAFAGQIVISHLNGNFRAIAARRAVSLTSSRTTNVPTAPMFTTPNFANCLAMAAVGIDLPRRRSRPEEIQPSAPGNLPIEIAKAPGKLLRGGRIISLALRKEHWAKLLL